MMTDQTPVQVAAEGDENEISWFDLLQVGVDNLRLLVLGPLLIGFIALGVSFFITPTFTATTTFLPPQQQQSAAAAMMQSLGALGGLGATAGLRSQVDQYIALAGSRSVEDALVDRFELVKRYDASLKHDARMALERLTTMSAGRDGLIKIEFQDHDPKFAADVANGYVDELSKLMGRLALTEAQQRRSFFEGQLSKAKEGLTKAELALKLTGIGESAVKAIPQLAVSNVATLMAQVAAKEVQLSGMRSYLNETAPDFKRAQSELAALREQLSRAEKDTAGADGSDYVTKYRDFKYYETLYELMAKQYEIARIDESREGAVIQVVDQAVPPERKSKPKKALIAMIAALATGILLLLFVFLRQMLRHGSKNPETAQKIGELRGSFLRAIRRN